MSSSHNSVETVNAAATAIVTAESRVQPSTVQKRRWGSFWSIYWCFGSYKHNHRIGHAVLVSEPAAPGVVAPISESRNHSSSIVLPFIAPPSSPASFLQSDPPSATQSPAGGLLSVNAHSPGGTAPMFIIGPYAHETQLVSPPVFSTYTTEPSTANFTPPPEPVQMTTPSSPEVPFAQLLSSSLERNKRNCGNNLKYSLSQYEFKPYQYPCSPGAHIKSPGSAISTSGTSSPFPDKLPITECRMVEAPKYLGYEHSSNYKWDSTVGSGSLTPNGTLTPNGGLSRLGSGTVTPSSPIEAALADSDHKPLNDNVVVDHRVSFELFGEDIPICTVTEPIRSNKNTSGDLQEKTEGSIEKVLMTKTAGENASEAQGMPLDGEEEVYQKHRTISLGSSKDFNFNNAKGEVAEKSSIECEWWTNEKVVKKELGPRNSSSFLPMLQSETS